MALRELPPGYHDGHPKRDVNLKGALAAAFMAQTRDRNMMILDPDNPKADPNALLRDKNGRMLSIDEINFNCPFCHQTMSADLMMAHAFDCVTRNYHMRDATMKTYRGAGLETVDGKPLRSTTIKGEPARGDSGAR